MLNIEDLNFQIGDLVLFQDFNLSIKKNEKILLDSPSGKGKSSLVKMIMGYLKPQKGKIIINDMELNPQNIKKIRSMISYVSQDVDLRNEKIKDLIDEIFSYKVNKSIEISTSQIIEKLEELDLKQDILEKKIRDISGGERQRIGFLIAWCLNRPIWIIDEITSGLDLVLKKKILEIVKRQDSTFIIISHDDIWKELDQTRIIRW